MRAWMGAGALLALIGCGNGDGDETGNSETCDDRVTSPLTDVANDQWPDGLDAAVTAYKELAGTWEAENCLDDSFTVSIKITAAPIEEIDIITSGVSSSTACGCLNDPEFQNDSAYAPVAIAPPIEVSIEMKEDEGIDPGLDNRTFTLAGGMFGPNQPLLYRACSTDSIDPIFASDYDQVATIFRLEPNDSGTLDADEGTPTMTFFLDTLTQGGATTQCDLTGLVKTVDPGQ